MRAILFGLVIFLAFFLVGCPVSTPTKKRFLRGNPEQFEALDLTDVNKADPQLLLKRTVQYLEYEEVFSWSFAHIPDGEWNVWVKAGEKWYFFDGGKFSQSNPMVLFFALRFLVM